MVGVIGPAIVAPSSALFVGWADAGVVASGTDVTQWSTQSASGINATQGTAGRHPIYVPSGGPGGRAYLSLTGSPRAMLINDVAAPLTATQNQPHTWFALLRREHALATSGTFWIAGDQGGSASFVRANTFAGATGPNNRFLCAKRDSVGGATQNAIANQAALPDATWRLVGAVCHGTTVDIYSGSATPIQTGVAWANPGAVTPAGEARLFCTRVSASDANYFVGDCALMVIDNRAWNADEVQAFFASAAQHYGGEV